MKPVVHDIRFYAPATPRWGRRPANVALLPQAGRRLNRARLSGKVDIRVRASDPQSFIGWFKQIPHLASPHHPFRMAVTIVQVATRKVVHRRDVFWAEQMLEMPAGQHFAPGTEQNLPANGCMLFHRTVALRRHVLVSIVPTPVLGHDATGQRALLPPRPGLGHRRQHDEGRPPAHDPELTVVSDGIKRWTFRYRAHNGALGPPSSSSPGNSGPNARARRCRS